MTVSARPTSHPWARLDPLSGWRIEGTPDGLVITGTGLRLGVPGQRAVADTEPFGTFGGRTLPTGLAIAPDGRLFLADPGGSRVLTWLAPPRPDTPVAGQIAYPPQRPNAAPAIWPFAALWPARPVPDPEVCGVEPGGRSADPYALVEPVDLAIAPNGDLAIADAGGATGVGRVLVIVLPSGAVRQCLDLPGVAPAAIGFDAHSNAYVADRDGNRILRFDAHWQLDRDYAGGAGVLDRPTHLHVIADPGPHRCGGGGSGCACADNGTCDCLSDGTVLVIDRSGVTILDPKGRVVDAELPDALSPPALSTDADGGLIHDVPPRDPLRLVGLAVTRSGTLEGTGLPLLARPKRLVLPRNGSLVTQAIEGDRDGFAWHRVALEAEIPDRTRLVVRSYTSDAALEPSRIAALAEADWSGALVIDAKTAVPEVLIQSPVGRRLWLRVDFLGDGAATPLLKGVDIFGPRSSSLQLLPPPFRQDPESAHFLDRLLSYSDTIFSEITTLNAAFAAHLDPHAVPAGDFLDWLGRWFDWRFLAEWPDQTRREMIETSVTFFRERGTVAGLRRLLQWHSGLADPMPVIIEHHHLRDWDMAGGATRPNIGGLPIPQGEGRYAHHFTVVLPASAVPDSTARAKILDLIEAQKPAHTVADIRLVGPGLRIGAQSMVGVDTILGDWPSKPLGAGALGQTLHTAHGGPALGTTTLN
ncbi:phage tail protein [Fluviibacterium sp. DFM31]|uniref:Phage tail protein n=1 Tax=Meridianimarinicoccus marinus TaxID=3231483 RepID=A0ABV3L8V4_9RHOB